MARTDPRGGDLRGTLGDRGMSVAPVLKRGLPPSRRSLARRTTSRSAGWELLDEGSIATTDKAGGCRWGTSTYPEVDLDPLQGRRSSKVLIARNRLLKSTFRPRPRVAADTIVQSLSGDADALLDCYNEKGLQIQAFSRAADGIRTHDLLHGKQFVGLGARAECPCKSATSAARARAADASDFTLAVWIGSVTSGFEERVRPAAS
jgi:hypothetical protein